MKKNLLLLFATLLMMVGVKAQEIIVSPTSLTDFYYDNGGPSEVDTIVVSASGLNSGVIMSDTIFITAHENFEISLQSNGEFGEFIPLNADAHGTVNPTNIYVRMIAGLAANTYEGDIFVTSKFGVDTIAVHCSGVVDMPTLLPPSFSLESGTYSGAQYVTINCGEVDASIKYRIMPDEDWEDYLSPILVNRNMTLCAKAIKEGYYDSEDTCSYYVIEYSISAAANKEEWGSVSYENKPYHYGDTLVLEAIAKDSTEFIQWNNGDIDNPRQIIVTGDSTYTAFFQLKRYFIELNADPTNGGEVSGGGFHLFGRVCTIHAEANEGFTFINWTENDTVVSRDADYTFYAYRSRAFVAHFVQVPVVGEIDSPSSICDGEALDIVVPEAVNAEGGEWQMSPDENFDSITPYYIGQTLDQSYNGWYLRYEAHNEYGSSYSNSVVISIHSFIDANTLNEIVQKDDYVLIYPNPAAVYKYQWYKDGEKIEGANKQYYYQAGGLDSGIYKVYVSFNENGGNLICGAFSHEIVVNVSSLSFYPNPSHAGETIIMVSNGNEEAVLNIYSIDGRLLHTQAVVGDQTSLSLNLPGGIYVAYLINKEGSKTEKIVIQ